MRFTAVIAIALLMSIAIEAKKKSAKKSNDWDELESLLENIDEIGTSKKKAAAVVADTPDDEDPLERDRIQAGSENNPCSEHVCGWGKECIVDKKGTPTCECIRECPNLPDPDPFDQVCSNQNETFPTLCHLYRERCLCKHKSDKCDDTVHAKAHLEYLGACKELDKCTDELMEQFPGRMADWLFQVMRELKKRRELHNLEWEELINEAEFDDEKKHVYPVIWKFCDLDIKPHDKHVTHHELIPITAPVMPMESCIKPFLEKCDADNDGQITIKEWGKCLGLKEGEIQERC
uniref:EF-hand domain-containing protein n=1 Tax=Plectus sambesii TaxID=2011161 RepID=A0A914V4Y4_9BILA